MLVPDSKIGRLLLGIVEFLPLTAFVYSGRLGFDLAERFYCGAGAVIAILPILLIFRWKLNPLLIAVNAWLLIQAFAFLVDVLLLAKALGALQESSFFLAIIVVGIGSIAVSRRGLLTTDHGDQKRIKAYSLLLLLLACAGLACSFVFRGDEMFAAALPAAALFLTQMLMSARLNRNATDS